MPAMLAASVAGRMLGPMNYTAVIERDKATGLLVGSIPGIPGAHTTGTSVEEVGTNLQEVLALLKEQGAVTSESDFVATIQVAA
jgi:predicted RNase H-like HicB family nuclease